MGSEPSSTSPSASGTSFSKHAASGAVWLLLDVGGVQGLSFATFAVIARFVSHDDIGLISIAFLVTQSVKVMLIDAVAVAVTRKQRPSDLEYTTGFWLTVLGALLATAIVVGLAGSLESLFNAPGLRPVMAAMSLTIPMFSLSRMHQSWMARHFRFKLLALRSIIGSLAGAVVGIVLARDGFGAMALVCQQLVMGLTVAVLLWVTCPWRPTLQFSSAAARETLLFMRSLLGNSLLSIISQNGDTALVTFLFGPASAGVYNVGKRAKLALQMLAWGPVSGVVTPMFAEVQSDPQRLRRGMLTCTTLICALCAPIFFGTAAVSDEAMLLVFGTKWAAAGPVLGLLAFGGFAQIVLNYNEGIFLTQNRPVWCMLVSLLYIALVLPLVLILSRWPALSLAAPFVLPYVVVVPVSVYLAVRLTQVSLRNLSKAALPGLFSAAIMYAFVRYLDGQLSVLALPYRLAALCSAGGIVYLSVLLLVGRQSVSLLWNVTRRIGAQSGA